MGIRLAEIVSWVNGRIANPEVKSESLEIERLADLGGAGRGSLAFFFSRDYIDELKTARPSALITAEPFVAPLKASGLPLWKEAAVVVCADPYMAMAILSEKFAPYHSSVAHIRGKDSYPRKIHPQAVLDPSVEMGENVAVGANTFVDAGAKIGKNTVIYPGCFIGQGVSIGEDSVVFPNVTLYENTRVGSRVRIHAGAVIGADGFGYAPLIQSGVPVGHQKIYHLGRVVIGNDVEIGANTCVDRGTFGDTVIGDKVKLDDQVMIGHNCQVGEGTILCGCAGMAGNASTGRYVYIGGLSGIKNQVHVGDFAKIGACSAISKNVPAGEKHVGNPQRTHRDHFRIHAKLNKMLGSKRGVRESESES